MIRHFKRSFSELDAIVTMTEAVFNEKAIDPSIRFVVDLAIEELFTNMVKYNTGADHDIEIEITGSPTGAQVSLRDFDVD
ncbi:MAG TPA: hypothetical protein VJ998_03340, partial [Pseudomonadales bacterium]|nr:hypothetical protein [Pseudomonadales bacterium]